MSLRYRYRLFAMGHPLIPLSGRTVRPRPLIPVTLIGPGGTSRARALVDTGADDTLFPDSAAVNIGLDLTNAPVGAGAGIGMAAVPVRYAQVMLRLAAGSERREWAGWVGFTSAPLRHPVLGFAGCLQYFDALFLGGLEELELTVNDLYPGTP